MSKVNKIRLQDVYEYNLANKTTWYRTHMEALIPQLKDVLGEDYLLIQNVYKYVCIIEKPNGFYSSEDIFKIKVNTALRHIKEIHEELEASKAEEDNWKKENYIKE